MPSVLKEGARDHGSKGIVVSVIPDICLTPRGNTMVPIPYNIIAKQGDDANTVPTVRQTGMRSHNAGSIITKCYGDEKGTGGGIHSGTTGSICEPKTWSKTVRIAGKPAVRHGDEWWMNKRNTYGKLYFLKDTNDYQPPQVSPTDVKDRLYFLLKRNDDNVEHDYQAAPALPPPEPVEEGNGEPITQDNNPPESDEAPGINPGQPPGKGGETAPRFLIDGPDSIPVYPGQFFHDYQPVPGTSVYDTDLPPPLDRIEVLPGDNILVSDGQIITHKVLDDDYSIELSKRRKLADRIRQDQRDEKEPLDELDLFPLADRFRVSEDKLREVPCLTGKYSEIKDKCPDDSQAHHIVPDWSMCYGSGQEPEKRIPGLLSHADGPAICLHGYGGNETQPHGMVQLAADAAVMALNSPTNTVPGTSTAKNVRLAAVAATVLLLPQCADQIEAAVNKSYEIDGNGNSKYDDKLARVSYYPPKEGTLAYRALALGLTSNNPLLGILPK